MSNLTPAGVGRVNQETLRLAENDRERELATYRPGDKNLMLFNVSGLNRITQEKQARSGQSSAATAKPGASLITGKQTTKRKRIHGMGQSTGEEKSGTVKKQSLGGK
jgi:hypothetical protein|tara:strand:+ start:81 stop:401 length:321 start_codon:yes stop_codon:yes gene_type:complete